MSDEMTSTEISDLEGRLRSLQVQVDAMEGRLPQSNIIHPHFWPRAWTVFGYNLATTLAIYAVFLALGLAFSLLGSLFR